MQLRQVKTLGKVMAEAQGKWFLPNRNDGKSRELRLELSREPQPVRTQTPE